MLRLVKSYLQLIRISGRDQNRLNNKFNVRHLHERCKNRTVFFEICYNSMIGIFNNIRNQIGAITQLLLSGFLNYENGDKIICENGDSLQTEDQ